MNKGNKEVKYYVVWKGRKPGIYESWEKCKEQVFGFDGAAYKSFKNEEEAIVAYNLSKNYKISSRSTNTKISATEKNSTAGNPILDSISVDGAGNNLTGLVEYQGVYTRTKQVLFKRGPFDGGTNNLVEFLALVHALAFCQERNIDLPIYSDSKTAITWVKNKKIKTIATKDESNIKIFEYVEGAIKWLNKNTYKNKIHKWETHLWGEIPADFGRK
jgi:ribonuclease HI